MNFGVEFFHAMYSWQDWRSVRAVHPANKCRVLGNVDKFALQWWEPRHRQVCARVCVRLDGWVPMWYVPFWMSPVCFSSVLQYINQRLKHRDRWVGALTSTSVPCEFTPSKVFLVVLRRFSLTEFFRPVCFSAHDLRTPGSSQSPSSVHQSLPVSFTS